MFAYNPQTQDRSGEIMAAGIKGAADLRSQAMSSIGTAIASLAQSYVKDNEKKSKANSYEKFLTMHGPQMFGEEKAAEVLDQYKNMSTNEKVAYGDTFVGKMYDNSVKQQYLEQQMNGYSRWRGGSGGGSSSSGGSYGGGSSSAAGGYVVGQGWVGQQ